MNRRTEFIEKYVTNNAAPYTADWYKTFLNNLIALNAYTAIFFYFEYSVATIKA